MELENKKNHPSTKKVLLTSFLVDVLDVVSNFVIALVSGSVVVFAQVLKGLADLLTSAVLFVGVKQSGRLANKQYQFGYGREIFFWALVSAVCMFVVTGGVAFYLGFQRFKEPQVISHLNLTFIVLTISLFTNIRAFWLSWQRLTFAGKHNVLEKFIHSGLIETKTTLLKDLMGSVASLLGLAALVYLQITDNFRLDGLGAMVVGVVTAGFALYLIKDAKDLLVGKAASVEIEEQIKQAALMIKGVQEILDLRTMYLGSAKLLVNIEVHLDHNLKTQAIENIIDAIKEQVMAQVPSVHHIQVELEAPENPKH